MRSNLDGTEVEEMGRANTVFIGWPTGKLYVGNGDIERRELNGEAAQAAAEKALAGLILRKANDYIHYTGPTTAASRQMQEGHHNKISLSAMQDA